MATTIVQSTFDDIVCENIKEFEMNVSEAMEDAFQQLESQGVDLTDIVQDEKAYANANDGPIIHTVVTLIEQLKGTLDDATYNNAEAQTILDKFVAECLEANAKNYLAGKYGAYDVLLDYLIRCKDSEELELMEKVLDSLRVLLTGQSKLLKSSDTPFFLELAEVYQNQINIFILILKVISVSCITNEANRQAYVNHKIVSKLIDLMLVYKGETNVVKEICSVWCVLTVDDDATVPFGQSHENSKLIATERNGLKLILELCKDYNKDASILKDLFVTLSRLLVRTEFCQQILDLGGIPFLLSAFRENLDNAAICQQVMVVLKHLAGNDIVKEAIITDGAMDIIVAAMTKYGRNAYLCAAGCALLAALALRCPPNAEVIMAANGAELIVQTMKLHPDSPNVQKLACMAVRNLVARSPNNCLPFLELGIEALANKALKKYSSDEVKSALRDLGCKVDLKEIWKGEKGSIPQ